MPESLGEEQKAFLLDDFMSGETRELNKELVELLKNLRKVFNNCPLWMCVNGDLYPSFYNSIFRRRAHILPTCPALILIDSPGGLAKTSFQVARLFNRRGGFIALIPRSAKSAATLLSLGAEEIYMGLDAELGPLDAQYSDSDREDVMSALDEVHSLERLNAAAMEVFDQTMQLLLPRTGKRVDYLLPISLDYTASILKPLVENIDAVNYTRMSRVLRVAEQYAVRLLSANHRYSPEEASNIARRLVEMYSEHGFVIDSDEARGIGLKIQTLPQELSEIFEALIPHFGTGEPLIGQFKEIESEPNEISSQQGESVADEAELAERSRDGHRSIEGG